MVIFSIKRESGDVQNFGSACPDGTPVGYRFADVQSVGLHAFWLEEGDTEQSRRGSMNGAQK
jgi:hypothetical protein